MDYGKLAEARLSEIAGMSATGPGVTRLPWTAEHRRAIGHITSWMQDAGLDVSLDAAGTLIGRTPGMAGRPALLLGSHQDSVRSGGRFDGIMGVAVACLAVRRLADEGVQLPFAVEVLAFADEEGVRFPTALIGPRALAGSFDPTVLEMRDAEGVSMGQAMEGFGLDPGQIPALARRQQDVVGYLEAHIEQGPVLEAADRSLGVVTAICGISRHSVTFEGETGHAGTVPMEGRRDALVAAARFIAAVSDAAAGLEECRATVGKIEAKPGVVNAIPSRVDLTLELRAPTDDMRLAFHAKAQRLGDEIAAESGVSVTLSQTYEQPAVACAPGIKAALTKGMTASQLPLTSLPSGATHDASAMADLCPVGMLFVRCKGGISHRPDEHASAVDMGDAIRVLAETIKVLASKEHG
ncbi:Zn-dependent hydrolase [Brevirhabdus pacifica]|uniref:Zn-dependent hydrolase n=1 Tax=Brevirhabdus pacifica TaxID=1267768 RepID=A0A1U7DF58_9RHOB|nr:M20 family metallo-hydrolase [Brevirhabdus pacifica]APX88533.1 Zn-dependent hydrolase [Brevirhabdus pacifica]OWU79831.1 allantoate amidohydrolase [Loktanella sp. 22II-4b]PJJ86985.1 allantoate deiminase [Brevirhabdus pacifica]